MGMDWEGKLLGPKIFWCLGFQRTHDLVIWLLLATFMAHFVLSRLSDLDLDGVFCVGRAFPGECYFWQNTLRGKIGILLHLATIFPATILVVLQFLPVFWRRYPMVHRLNGYVVILLSVSAMAGVILIARHTWGGSLEIQTAAGFFVILFVLSLLMAMYSIKKRRIDSHRAWMLRACAVVRRRTRATPSA